MNKLLVMIVVSSVLLAGCDENPFAKKQISAEMQREYAEGDRIQEEVLNRINQQASPASVLDLSCPQDMSSESHDCSLFLQQRYLSSGQQYVSLELGFIHINLEDGRKATLDNKAGNTSVCGVNEDGRFLILRQKENISEMEAVEYWALFDRKKAEITNIIGKPVFSPMGNSVVVHSIDLDAEYMPTVLDVYSIKDIGLSKDFIGITEESASWGPEKVEWQDEQMINFEEVRINTNDDGKGGHYIRVRKHLFHAHGKWFIQDIEKR